MGNTPARVAEIVLQPSSNNVDENFDIDEKVSVQFLKKSGYFQLEKDEIENFSFVRRFSYGCNLYKGYYKEKLVCVKEYDLSRCDDSRKFAGCIKEDEDKFQEIDSNEFIGKVYGLYFSRCLFVGVVSEYYLRDLRSLIMESNRLGNVIVWEKKIEILRQIILGMIEIHNVDIIHHNLKPENIVFDYQNKIKIINFFGTKYEKEQQQRSLKTKYFDSYYQSPECTLSDCFQDSTDVYSFSMIIFELLTEKINPFKGDSPCDLSLQIARRRVSLPEIPTEYIESSTMWLVEMICDCRAYIAEKRPSFRVLLKRFKKAKKKVPNFVRKRELDVMRKIKENKDEMKRNVVINNKFPPPVAQVNNDEEVIFMEETTIKRERKKHAFVVGQNVGGRRSLYFPYSDGIRMKAKLKEFGYECFEEIYKADEKILTYSHFRRRFNKFCKNVGDGDQIVIYFSGHGYQRNGENYLQCLKTDEEEEDMSLTYLVKKLREKETNNIFLLDCCQDDPQNLTWREKGGSSNTPIGNIQVNEEVGSFVFGYACLPGLTSLEKGGGVYTTCLLECISQQEEICVVLRKTSKLMFQREGRKGSFFSTAMDDLFL